MVEKREIRYIENPLEIEERGVFEIGTHVRVMNMNFYSTYTKAIEFFGLVNKTIPCSEILQEHGIPYRLEGVPKRWQLTEYIVGESAIHKDGTTICYIRSLDNQSHLILPENCLEEIEEFHTNFWDILREIGKS